MIKVSNELVLVCFCTNFYFFHFCLMDGGGGGVYKQSIFWELRRVYIYDWFIVLHSFTMIWLVFMETEKRNFSIIQDIRLYPPNEYTNNRMKNNHQELNGLHPILIASHKKSEISHFRILKIITKDHCITMHQLQSKKKY